MNELRMPIARLALLLGLTSCGKSEPDPFGKLSKDQLARWTNDCSQNVTDTRTGHDKHDPDVVTVRDRLAFATATHRLRCAPDGWTLWLDASERIAGVCTAGYVDVSITPSRIETPQQRGDAILRRHFPKSLADEMLAGFCVSTPHDVGRRLLRWQFEFPQRREHSAHACCWEVKQEN